MSIGTVRGRDAQTPEEEGMKFGDAKSTAARGALTLGEEAGREGGGPGDPRPRAGGLGAGPGEARSRAPTGSPQPAAAGGIGVPRTAKVRWPSPRHLGGQHAGVPGVPHLESGGAVGSGRRNLPQRNRRHRK